MVTTIAIAQYRLGDFKAAADTLTKTSAPYPYSSWLNWLFLGMTHWQLGNKVAANHWYNLAVPALEAMLKNAEFVEKFPQKAEELRRFRAEARELLQIKVMKE